MAFGHMALACCGNCTDGGGDGDTNPCGFICPGDIGLPTSWSDLTTRANGPNEDGWWDGGGDTMVLDGRMWPIRAPGAIADRPTPFDWDTHNSFECSFTGHTRYNHLPPLNAACGSAANIDFSCLVGTCGLDTTLGCQSGIYGPKYSYDIRGLDGLPIFSSGTLACGTTLSFSFSMTLGEITASNSSPCWVERTVTRGFSSSEGASFSDTRTERFVSPFILCGSSIRVFMNRQYFSQIYNFWPIPVNVSAVSYSAS